MIPSITPLLGCEAAVTSLRDNPVPSPPSPLLTQSLWSPHSQTSPPFSLRVPRHARLREATRPRSHSKAVATEVEGMPTALTPLRPRPSVSQMPPTGRRGKHPSYTS